MSAAVALLVALTGCGGGSAAPADQSGRHPYTIPHVLRYATASDISGLNPMFADEAVVYYLASMTMAWLLRTGPDGLATVPELATELPSQRNGGISADGKTITYHLRRGVKWSDGAPFDADDVVFSIEQVLNPKNNVISREGWEQIKSVGEPDKYTVVLHLAKPYAAYAATFFTTGNANPAIIPKHLLAGNADLNHVAYNALPIGIGPFKYQSWRRSDSVVLVANPNYWRGKPKLERIVYKLIPDRETVIEQLRTHEIDLWPQTSSHYVPRIKQIEGVTYQQYPSFTYDHIDFNLQRPMFQDRAVREALRYATPRAEINQKIRFGLWQLGEAPVTPASSFYNSAIAPIPYDIAKANALLDGAGWKRGSDGVRTKGGQRLSIDFAITTGAPDTDAALELIRTSWKQAGAEITVHHYPPPLLFAQKQAGGILYGGKYDAAIYAWTASPIADLANIYACNRFPPDGQNSLFWCNREATAAIERSQITYDTASRKKDVDLAQTLVVQDAPTIVLDYRKFGVAYNTDLKNWHPNEIGPFDDMMNVDI